jgi:hypothetical protein
VEFSSLQPSVASPVERDPVNRTEEGSIGPPSIIDEAAARLERPRGSSVVAQSWRLPLTRAPIVRCCSHATSPSGDTAMVTGNGTMVGTKSDV